MQDYNKMEQSSMEQQNIIISLEQICQEFEEQHVIANIKFEKQKQVLIVNIQDWKG